MEISRNFEIGYFNDGEREERVLVEVHTEEDPDHDLIMSYQEAHELFWLLAGFFVDTQMKLVSAD